MTWVIDGWAPWAPVTCAMYTYHDAAAVSATLSFDGSLVLASVPYQATSMLPSLPATTQGMIEVLEGARETLIGADQWSHSLLAPGGDHE